MKIGWVREERISWRVILFETYLPPLFIPISPSLILLSLSLLPSFTSGSSSSHSKRFFFSLILRLKRVKKKWRREEVRRATFGSCRFPSALLFLLHPSLFFPLSFFFFFSLSRTYYKHMGQEWRLFRLYLERESCEGMYVVSWQGAEGRAIGRKRRTEKRESESLLRGSFTFIVNRFPSLFPLFLSLKFRSFLLSAKTFSPSFSSILSIV